MSMQQKYRNKSIAIAAALAAVALLSGCASNAQKASENLSTAADNFEVQRKIVGINTRTDKFLFYVEGRCSIARDGDLVVTCKHGENDYRKHFVGLSNDTTFVSEQLGGVDVSVYHTRIILKPENIIPEVELQGGRQ